MKKRIVVLSLVFVLAMCLTANAQSFTSGTVQFSQASYTGKYAASAVTVIDSDLNLNPIAVDKASVLITSSADPKGITLVLNETAANTGVFKGSLKFSNTVSSSASGAIKVSGTCSLNAQYKDSANVEGVSKVVTDTSSFKFTDAVISTSAKNDSGAGNMLDITIYEPDSNNPDSKDTITAKIGAGNSKDDLTYHLEETGTDTAEFKQTVYFTDRSANKNLLDMSSSNKINILYVDQTTSQNTSKEIIKTIGWNYQSTVITLDKESYQGYNSWAKITLYNMELNNNSSKADTVYVDIEASNNKSIKMGLKETKSSSGVFEGTLYFGEKSNTNDGKLKMDGASNFTVSYTNKRDDSDVAECTADWSPQDGVLTLNRQVYYGDGAIVTITLEDWDVAENLDKKDKVSIVAKVKGTARKKTFILEETKSDSGIFAGSIYINSSRNNSFGMSAGEILEITYTDKDTSIGSEETRVANAEWAGVSKPELYLDHASYKGYGASMLVSLKDPDYNRNEMIQESVEVLIKTSSSKAGIRYVLRETGDDTGLFIAELVLSNSLSNSRSVRVGDVDTIAVTLVGKNVGVSVGFSK